MKTAVCSQSPPAALCRLTIAVALLAIGTTSCADRQGPQGPDGIACTAQFVYGLVVTVKDTATGQPVCDAVVTAISGSYGETLHAPAQIPEGCSYLGAGERPGVYDLSASRDGFAVTTMNNVRVNADVCHVIPTRVTLELKR
jgi:hypothetical protein